MAVVVEPGFKINVTRLEPQFDVSGARIDGFLRSFTRPVTLEEIQKEFGGGVYKLTLVGTDDRGGQQIKGTKQIHITGAVVTEDAPAPAPAPSNVLNPANRKIKL